MGGERLISVQLANCPSKEEFVKRIKEHALQRKEGEWITGGDWDHELWGGDNRLPDRAWIDAVTPNNPVWINRKEGHQYLANTLALQLAGLDPQNIPDVEGGTVWCSFPPVSAPSCATYFLCSGRKRLTWPSDRFVQRQCSKPRIS